MTRASLLCIVAVLFGCAPDLTNGGLRCSVKSECPSGYHCAIDETCWRNGEDPTVADLSATPEPDGGGLDLSTAPDLAIDNGQPCQSNSQCGSGSCADGVCCDAACTDSCLSCNQLGHVGTCTAIASGQMPAHGHASCETDSNMPCGNDGTCDGEGACRRYGSNTVCGNASCSGDALTPAPRCDGLGSCVLPASASCSPYICTNNACTTSCSVGDCAANNVCTGGVCVPK